MQNPFETGHIKNYLLLYASVVVIMVLFFIASSFFNDIQEVEHKVFNTEIKEKKVEEKPAQSNSTHKFQLLEKAY
jgi:hypothetical protein